MSGPARLRAPMTDPNNAAVTRPRTEGIAQVCVLAGAVLFAAPWKLIGLEGLARWTRPEIALAAGMVLGLLGLAALEKQSKSVARLLIQLIVVFVGFRIDLADVVRLGGLGLVLGTGVILTTFVVGLALARILAVQREVTTLLCSGTAVCGGSAIAAVGSAIGASAPAMAVALGSVFILNAVSLYLMPVIGGWLGMSSAEFGTWAGLAIHDYSSVLAASRAWDEAHGATGDTLRAGAEQAATVTKAARVLWIVPIAVTAASLASRSGQPGAGTPRRRFVSPLPWFIAAFLIASAIRTVLPEEIKADTGAILFSRARLEAVVKHITGAAMPLALFLIGTGLSRATLAAVGWRAFVLGVSLWLIIGAASLLAVRTLV